MQGTFLTHGILCGSAESPLKLQVNRPQMLTFTFTLPQTCLSLAAVESHSCPCKFNKFSENSICTRPLQAVLVR